METKQTLTSMFETNIEVLEKELSNLTLPADAGKIQNIISQYLNTLFENESVYRQSLNQSEDYILLAAIELLYAQQNIAKEITKSTIIKNIPAKEQVDTKCSKTSVETALVASGVGAGLGAWAGKSIGGSLLGITTNTWGAMIGAIVGTAIVLYSTLYLSNSKSSEKIDVNHTINSQIFINIVKSICEKIDGLIETFRVQVKRIKNVYEQREKSSLQSDYSILLKQIVNVYNLSKSSNEIIPIKVSNAIELMAESLENYGLKIENGKIVNC